MVVIMEDFGKPSFNTLEEVKKLQDLVRKLEIQNQQLRNKQNKASRKSSHSGQKENVKSQSPPNVLKQSVDDEIPVIVGNGNNNCTADDGLPPTAQNDNCSPFDEIEILRLSDVDMSDDDSWLYKSPRSLTAEQKRESPHEWLRKDIDNPLNKELQMTKKALITKLNELEILSPTSQRNLPVTSKVASPRANQTVNSFTKSRISYKFTSSTQEQCSVLDTRTFTKSKKKQALEYLAASFPIEMMNEGGDLFRRESDVSLDSIASTYTLTDANDVQEVARMQEESLRMNSPIGTPKRQLSVTSNHSGRRMSVSSKSSVSDIDNAEFPSLNSQGSFEETACRPLTVTPIPVEKPIYSDHSSPSQSPYGSNASLSNASDEKGDVYRRSLPNLNRSRSNARQLSPSEKRKQKSFASKTGAAGHRSDSNLLLAASSKPRREAPSPLRNRVKQPSNYVTPPSHTNKLREPASVPPRSTVGSSTRPPVKSGLPRPARATSATRLMKMSGIPVPSAANKKHEDSWSEGCF